ncbi:zinc finger protein 469 [Pygocentrus nattereri]|uniref:zinc finger protein 469 n=1 Tax=Pygocentrus nattereri TaxID=42514 RepID=UPI000814AE7B|nr:zinc finger protein 469 [Pygocentrus nattereri]XP_017555619.1 zinc finger protein 469 [Pygocentrus nattereri]XP_037398474.1 zinc finger protein 469 [Pygocentrus nattereri]XP_037398475.1 zinc finger protein 469 [Pygocentrus nattereri]
MAGETKRTYAGKELDTESNQHENGPAREQFNEKALKGSPDHFQNVSLESQTVNNGAKFVEKERENTQQREAVIRPQQAGKIDFKSLQNHSKFASDRTWPSGKGSPQSPSGKSRNRDKAKKSGKGERGNPQQLYRLSITNPRSNPTIGIAYPQQKVSPPKKLEASRGPVSGSYRFHVPSIPEREAELQQEELNYNRCFQEGSSNLTSPSYTSQPVGSAAGGPVHQHPPPTAPQHQPGQLETSNTQPVNQILFSDFQLGGADMWQSPDRTFSNSSFGVPSQKPNNVMEVNKPNGFVPLSFQYGYPLLDDAATAEPFPCDQNPQSQDFIEASLGSNQVPQNSFSFQSSGEEHDVVQSNAQFSNEQSEDRPPYSLHSKAPQYVQTPHSMPSSVHCTRTIGEDVSTGESSVSSSHQTEQNKSVLSDKSDTYCPVDTRDVGVTTGSKRGCHSKNSACSQRALIQGSVHHVRNIAQGQSSQLHFSNKAYSSPPSNTIHMGTAPHDKNNKNHSRVTQPWEGPNKTFPSPMDQNSTPYPVQCQTPLEQRQTTGINSRMPWQQIHLTSAMPNQNRIELSRQLSNQQLTFLLAPSDWQEDSKSQKSNSQKSSNNFPSKRPSEAFSNLRPDSVKQGCSTIAPCQFTNKMESSQGQVTDVKNKSLYFGINQAIHGSASRNPSYTPLQVPTMGLMMVSPYDSPSHSPIQNPASSSTCSSLSPESTSPVNSGSDDSQNSKVPPPQFYHQHQSKASSDNLNSNQHHFHSEVSRTLHYNQDKAKENILSFSANIRHPKPNMESGKVCMDSYGMEHHPPPPYSAHQLLASSLATANLDQLDVLLTCKQCDQNFNNLASFLDHKQYCGQHTFAQNDFKDVRKVEDTRKFHTDHSKAITSGTSFAMSRSSSDLHLSLLGLNKNGEIMSDSEPKVDAKDDPMKLMLPPAPLPDLEMEDAKLDSLITEALNGLGYQSDNAEIDSSFIDAFVDDEITTTKCSSNRQTLKTKDAIVFESRSKHEFTSSEKSLTQGKYSFDSDLDCLTSDSKHADIIHKENNQDSEIHEKNTKEETSVMKRDCISDESVTHSEWVKETRKSDKIAEESENGPRFLLSRKFSERCGLKSLQGSTPIVKTTIPQSSSSTRSPTSQRPAVRDGKRKRASGGSWSKELIHKIVQQKNKLHKLHVKGTKNMQFSLVMERVTPTVQNPTFREYDYVSDSDEDCEPVKIASQGCLSQSIRCKYTYTKECKGRIRADRNKESQWKQDKIESFESKKSEAVSPSSIKETSGHQRVRRRSSRSSTSSEISTSVSISSESINSPKSIDRTDSDCEKRMEIRKKDQDSCEQEISPQRILKESSTSLALTFTKNTKHYSTDKILLSELKDSYTTSKCSNVISTSEETASEHTLTKSTVSLSRFKTTRVEVEEQMDHYGCEIGITAGTEEPTPLRKEYKDYIKASTHLRRPRVTLNPLKTKNEKDTNQLCKIKRDNNDFSKEKSLPKKRESQKTHQDSDSSSATLDITSDISSVKETKTGSSALFSEPPSLCSSLMEDVCGSPAKLHDASPHKDRNCLIPYSLEHEQSLMKSPLSFDTSSMFGDLTVSGFDNNLYPDIQLTKEGFGPIETTADKKELFESSFSPLLEQRDWSLIEDVTPELPDEISQYKEDSDITNDKKTSFNQVHFALPEKIMDYHPNLSSCVSEDELEIKRIVTELESQLQTAKPSPLDNETPKHLTMSKFSPLRLAHESESEQSSLDVVCSSESLALAAPPDSHPELFSEPDLPWSSPVQFGLMGGQQCLHTPTHSTVADTPINLDQEKLDSKDGTDLKDVSTEKQPALNNEEKIQSEDSQGTTTDKSEEMIEHEIYTENLMKSLEVMSDSLSSGLESSRSPIQEKECSAAKEQEKHDDKIEPTNARVDARNCSLDLNKKLLERPHNLMMHDICDSKLDDTLVTEESTSVAEESHLFLQVESTHLKELQSDKRTCESASTKDCDESSNTINLSKSPVIFEHERCEPSVCHVATGGISSESHVREDLNSKSLPNNPNVPLTLSDELKEDSTVCLNSDSSQEEIFLECNATEDDKKMLDSASAKHNIQDCENETGKIETAKINLDLKNGQELDSIESSYSGDVHLRKTQESDQDKVIPHEQPQMETKDQCCEPTSHMTSSPKHPSCGEHVQRMDEDSKAETLPPISPSPLGPLHISSKSSTVHAHMSPLTVSWTDIGMITPTLIEDRTSLRRESAEDIDAGRPLDYCESSATTTEINNSFAPHLDFAGTTESKISSPGTILAADSISKQAFSEASEKSEVLDVSQNKDTLYEFKLSPLNYSERHFSDCSSKTINNETDIQPNIKTSPKDSLDFSSCGLTLNTQLSSNCRLSPIHVQNELELTSQDHLVKLNIPHIHDTTRQNETYSYKSPTHHLQGENTEQLSKIPQGDLNACTVPLETIVYMDLPINLLKKADAENANSQINPFKTETLPQMSSMPSIQETVNSEEQLQTVSVSVPNVPNPMTGQCTKQSDIKSSPKKGGTHNAVQGKFQCEICFMFFRTIPGLKRHKAMKHTVKAEGIPVQNPTLSNQGFVPVYQVPQSVDKDLKDTFGILDPVVLLHPGREGVPISHGDQVLLPSVFEGIEIESNGSKNINSKDKEDKLSVTEKAKKNSKVKRSKSMDINNEGITPELIKQDTFSDELLSILKTDILQAISPDFPTMAQPECHKSPEKQSITNSSSCEEVKGTEECQGMESACGDEQEIATMFTKHPELYNNGAEEEDATAKAESCTMQESVENNDESNSAICKEYADTKEFLDVKEICDPCEDPVVAIKCESTTDENDAHSDGYKAHSLSPGELAPDLKALFDDESTFSQLFPRNDDRKRKKCARVYGKSNKKQKQMPSLISEFTAPAMFLDKSEENKDKTDNMFVSNLNEHCEYETTSLDDAKMLEMCHKSTLKSSVENNVPIDAITDHQTDYEDTPEVSIKDFLCQTEGTFRKTLVHLEGSEDTSTEKAGYSGTQGDCKAEVPTRPTPMELVCVQDNVIRHPSIDIQNLNTTFQLPEIQFFEPGRDISLVEDIASNNTEIKEPEKSPKKPTERKGRKRIETGLKPKDKQYKCKVCFTWFLTLGELDFHKLSHNPSPPPTCYMCVQRKFSSREQLRDHLREKHAKNKAGVWTCGMCLKEISDVWMYNEHLREHATQFARKGQSQSSLLDMPGCLMQENAVKNFISSIMQHRSNKSIKGQNAKTSKEERKASVDVPGVEQKSSDVCETPTVKTKVNTGGGSKRSTLTPLEVLHKAETTPKNVEMHPNCKDPSRDCHHCGKQFPKPFKLQRHLVVHSLQKIFMCHKCPVSYQEAKELRDHLKNEHEEVDELDSKHTTLYTCELCADVMHVIKKSFICSTCNYTFSKKEQFDRHMEKHLAGGNKIFKFRGVGRPCKPLKSKDDEFDIPPNKRRKLFSESSQDNSLDSGIASIGSIHLNQSTDTQSLKPIVEDLPHNSTNKQSTETNNTSVKIENEPEDVSEALEELGPCHPQMDSDEHTFPITAVPKEEDNVDTHTHELQNIDTREVGTDNRSSLADTYNVKIEEECGAIQTTLPMPISHEISVEGISMKECSGLANAGEMMEVDDSDLCNLQNSVQTNKSLKSQKTEDPLPNEDDHLEQPSPSNQMNQQKLEQINEHSSLDINESEKDTNDVEQPTCNLVKDKISYKPSENIKHGLDNSPRSGHLGATDGASVNNVKIPLSSIMVEDKDSIKQKKRKDLKTTQSSQRTASPATRENLGIDPKVKKKFRPNKCESVSGQRKADVCGDYPVLTSVKDDAVSNKIVTKHKIGALGLQPKRNPLDSFPPKKGELVRHLNGDCRGKKGVPGRSIHSPTSKVSVASLNNSFNKSRPKPGVKSVETHSYRTAESQNNLLSQLFGQRLTGFKIPLRKDTSESIN